MRIPCPLKNNIIKLTLALIMMLFALQNANSQFSTKGKDFWLSYMDILEEGGTPTQLYLMITSDVTASGTITIPLMSQSMNFTVQPDVTQIIEIGRDYGLNTEDETLTPRGIHITSDKDINVFALNYVPYVYEATLVFPTSSLGSTYYVASYDPVLNNGKNLENAASEFLIVAVENNSQIEITPTAQTLAGKAAGTPFTVTLNQGQVYQVKSLYDLTGSFVRSLINGGKYPKFFISSGNKCTNVGVPVGEGYCNQLWEQLFPVNSWGSKYITCPLGGRTDATYRIISSSDNNNVYIDGTLAGNINKGKFIENHLPSASVITSDFPVSVAQYSNSTDYDHQMGDPFMIMLSPVDQTRSDIQFHVNGEGTISANYLNVVTPTSCVNSIFLDGLPASTAFSAVPGDNSYSYAQISVTVGSHILSATGGCGFNAYVYGYGNADSYGYSAGSKIDTSYILSSGSCANSNISFSVRPKWEVSAYNWNFGDGGTSALANPVHTYTNPGNYTVSCKLTQKGTAVTETVSQIISIDAADCNFSYSVIGAQTVSFTDKSTSSGTIVSWTWDFGDGDMDFTQNPTHVYSGTGPYNASLTVVTANGCIATKKISVILSSNTGYSVVSLADTCVPVGAVFNLPVRLLTSSFLDAVGATKFLVTIKFNKSIMLPTRITSNMVVNFIDNYCYISISGTRSGTDSVDLLDIQFRALLGNTDNDLISIDYFAWQDANGNVIPNVITQTYNSNFCLTNICKAGGKRFFEGPPLLLLQNTPNPADKNTSVEFTLPGDGNIRLYITDGVGREIKTITEGFFTQGNHTINFETSSLTPGQYYYTIQTLDGSLTKRMEVVR